MAAHYPPEVTRRLILDHHSAHLSKETRAYLATRPTRFLHVHTPKHGAWLNLVEPLFLARWHGPSCAGCEGASWGELKARILQGIAEINHAPVGHRWRKYPALEPAK